MTCNKMKLQKLIVRVDYKAKLKYTLINIIGQNVILKFSNKTILFSSDSLYSVDSGHQNSSGIFLVYLG